MKRYVTKKAYNELVVNHLLCGVLPEEDQLRQLRRCESWDLLYQQTDLCRHTFLKPQLIQCTIDDSYLLKPKKMNAMRCGSCRDILITLHI